MATALKFRKILFQINAGFLIIMGGVFAALGYAGYRTGQGPWGELLSGHTQKSSRNGE